MAFRFASILSNIHRSLFILCVLTSSTVLSAQQQNTEESVAQTAEQAGKMREALTHYVTALQQATPGSDADQRLREKIIAMAQKLTPPPSPPDAVKTHIDRGRAAVQAAHDPEGLRRAVVEFREASKLAPWLGNIYFNLGAIEEKAGQAGDAIRDFKLYLLASPSASDADRVREKIVGLEVDPQKQKDEESRKVKAVDAHLDQPNSRAVPRLGPLDWMLGKWNMTESVSVASIPPIPGLTAEFVKNGDEIRAVWVHEDGSRDDLLRATTDILGVTRWLVLIKGIRYCNGQADQWSKAEITISADHHSIIFRQPVRVSDPDNGCPLAGFETKFELTR